jgi:NTP pyrophosphatase (non-canonical NTP hydrolase)
MDVVEVEEKEKMKLCQAALDKWGAHAQLMMFFEEMSELQKAVCKTERYLNAKTIQAVIEELADVLIMMDQIKIYLGLHETEINVMIEKKYSRLKKILSEVDSND